MFKKIFISFSVFLFLFFEMMPLSVEALTISDLQYLIQQLQQQVLYLQKQLEIIKGESSNWCYDFKNNLKIGDSGPDVVALQTALKKEGFYETVINNNFDEYTASAVSGFQEKYKNEILLPQELKYPTGYVGEYTLNKLNSIYGCNKQISVVPYNFEQSSEIQYYSNTNNYNSSFNQYSSGGSGGGSGIIQNVSSNQQIQSEPAILLISKDASSPKTSAYVSDTEGKVTEATMLVLAARAEKGRVKVTDLTATATGSATFSSLYLYDGDNLLASAVVSGGSATFSDLTDVYIDKDQTKLFTIKADFTGAMSTAADAFISIATSSIVAKNNDGTAALIAGSKVESDVIKIVSVHPILNLVSATLNYTAPSQGVSGTLSGKFNVKVKAGGADVFIPQSGAFTVWYNRPSATGTMASVTYSQPSNVTVDGTYYKIAKDQETTFEVNVATSSAGLPASDFYYLTVNGVTWSTTNSGPNATINWLDTTVWRTPTVYVQQ